MDPQLTFVLLATANASPEDLLLPEGLEFDDGEDPEEELLPRPKTTAESWESCRYGEGAFASVWEDRDDVNAWSFDLSDASRSDDYDSWDEDEYGDEYGDEYDDDDDEDDDDYNSYW